MTLPLTASAEPRPGPLLPELAGYRRPRLRDDVPILWREASCIQFGDEVVVDRITRAHVTWLLSLDGLRSPDQIEDDLPLPTSDARRLLRSAHAAAALEDASLIPDVLRWASPADRDQTARRFGAAVRTYRDLPTAFDAMAARDGCRVHVLGEGSLADEVRDALVSAGLHVEGSAHATLTVLADASHPEVPAHFDHAAQDRPHLHLGVLGDRAIVGPLVIPGITSCLRCAHLHHRDADPAWPLLAVQWSQALTGLACPPVDPLLVRLAAAHAALLVRTWADLPTQPEHWSGFAIDLRLPSGHATRVERPAHPLCGCGWPG
jgi:hypothetical protein